MEYKADKRPSLNGNGTGKLESPQHTAVPATLLPAVLSRLGLGDRPMVRVAAVRSLGERREVSSLQFLVSALHDPAWEVRAAAVWALSAFGGQAPTEVLIEALDDEDGSVRVAALRVLARVRERIPPEPLARMLHDADRQVREAAELTVEELKILGERYQLQDPIGRGGMATIHRGRDLRMDRVVAIKVLREVYNTDAKFVARFQQEAKAASALQHPNIVQVYDYGQAAGNYYIVMELVHRDVKPQNILVGRDGSIKLTDFGIASVYKDINAERLTTTGMTLGTVQYYAPEQAQGEIVSPAADVYALGIVMYEMLTGRPPFDGDSAVAVAWQHIQDPPTPPRQLNPTIPPALEEIILRCLEKVPEMRFRDGSQLARALETLGDAKLSESVPVTAGQAPTPTTSNHIPSRPSNSGRDGTLENVPPHSPASSPENGVGPGVPSDQNDADLVPGSLANQPVYPNQQSFAPPPGSVASHQFRRRTVPRSGVVQPDQRNARFASMITILILLATVLLLGFSVKSYQDAQTAASGLGFNLHSENGTDGVVIYQNPTSDETAPKGATIDVRMGPKTAKIPPIPQGATLASYEALLRRYGFTNFTTKPDGVDLNIPPNTVSRVNPTPGTAYDVTKVVTIYVKNDTFVTPAASPTP